MSSIARGSKQRGHYKERERERVVTARHYCCPKFSHCTKTSQLINKGASTIFKVALTVKIPSFKFYGLQKMLLSISTLLDSDDILGSLSTYFWLIHYCEMF